ncbi:hypothetical protein MUK42_28463 [Musa troglodytarum]|uniref:Uncharacterized protein n=1 Tax=Musa troglodytarum TaxID=320322 RepID=A0A9E7F7V7_9LILI|nr:hypothetical protein MUK42_28463 [Musa troglodytarum]URD90579.1 hypothetical protein MUK42_28463 [Musa troglodytarum]
MFRDSNCLILNFLSLVGCGTHKWASGTSHPALPSSHTRTVRVWPRSDRGLQLPPPFPRSLWRRWQSPRSGRVVACVSSHACMKKFTCKSSGFLKFIEIRCDPKQRLETPLVAPEADTFWEKTMNREIESLITIQESRGNNLCVLLQLHKTHLGGITIFEVAMTPTQIKFRKFANSHYSLFP